MEKTKKRNVGSVVETAMKEYGFSVIEDRALADLRDGLKPVQRRLLWSIWDRLKLREGQTPKKSARVVGETIGLFHAHGEASAYLSLVNMTFQNYPFVEGVGNFGDVLTKKPPAASRYTSVKATKLLNYVFEDSPVTETILNYSGETQEPVYLPSRVPSLFLNGSEGIAVGVRSHIPSHNLEELIKAALKILKNPDSKDFLDEFNGPDYPEGGIILSSRSEIKNLYSTGKGTIEFCCKYSFLKRKEKWILLVTGGAPDWNLTKFVEKCQALCKEGHLSDVANESSKHVRVEVISKSKENLEKKVIPLLKVKAKYELIALEGKNPVHLTLKDYLVKWLNFRREVVKKHLLFKIEQVEKNLLVEEAKYKAVKNIEKTIKALRSENPEQELKEILEINEFQVKVLLKSNLSLLTRLGEKDQEKIRETLLKKLVEFQKNLTRIDWVVKKELKELLLFSRERKTTLENS